MGNGLPEIYIGIAFGKNAFLRAHMDHNYTYSIAQVQIVKTEYRVDNLVACYLCFPRLGFAVPLLPGDFLLFNALESHCILSHCNTDQDVKALTYIQCHAT